MNIKYLKLDNNNYAVSTDNGDIDIITMEKYPDTIDEILTLENELEEINKLLIEKRVIIEEKRWNEKMKKTLLKDALFFITPIGTIIIKILSTTPLLQALSISAITSILFSSIFIFPMGTKKKNNKIIYEITLEIEKLTQDKEILEETLSKAKKESLYKKTPSIATLTNDIPYILNENEIPKHKTHKVLALKRNFRQPNKK